jgi:hypothetical protein
MVTGRQVQAAAETILSAQKGYALAPLSEGDLIRLGLAFANAGTLDGPLLRAPGVRVLPPLGAASDWVPTSADVVSDEKLAETRTRFRQNINAAIRSTASPQSLDRLKEAAAAMVAVPTFRVECRLRRALRVAWHYIPTNLESILAYVVLLLLDEERGFGTDLKSCSLPECGLLFFSSDRTAKTGRPRERFCTEEHMHEAHRRTSAARTQRYRKRKAREAAKAAARSTGAKK